MSENQEGQVLTSLGVAPGVIWGDKDATKVYAQILGLGNLHIFRFYRDPEQPRQSLPNRVVACYHDLEDEQIHGFRNQSLLRSTIWYAISRIWLGCNIHQQGGLEPDAIIDVISTESGEVAWRVYREPLYAKYIQLLRPVQPHDLEVPGEVPLPIVDMSEIGFFETLGSHGHSKHVLLHPYALSRAQADGLAHGVPTAFIFKGLDFQTYLQLHNEADDDKAAHAAVDTWCRANHLLANTPRHPNIQRPPVVLVTARPSANSDDEAEPVIAGQLSCFSYRGNLADYIAASYESGKRIRLEIMAMWCRDMARAVAHTHLAMRTYHMEIKPSNFIIDHGNNLVLVR
jgi:hypothetical protein